MLTILLSQIGNYDHGNISFQLFVLLRLKLREVAVTFYGKLFNNRIRIDAHDL